MVSFVLNNSIVNADVSPGAALIDYIRYEKDLPGTKIGCREGDCGACTVLEGSLQGDKVVYKSIVSCLTPVGNVHGKHIVTIEGLNMKELSPVQSALVENSGTQCGFCTPGFVMSLTCNCMKDSEADISNAIDAISGNICRCTGYKSIERAAESITVLMKDKDVKNPIKWLVDKNYIPAYFTEIPKLLKEIKENKSKIDKNTVLIGGGTDLVVQKPLEMAESEISFLYNNEELRGISKEAEKCIIKASTTADMIMRSPIMLDIIPEISSFFKLVSSEPVRNMGTIAGNIVNASPIADLTMFFLALNAEVFINSGNSTRVVPLRKFYLGYKKLDLKKDEFIQAVSFKIPKKPFHFNFEKVSKRTYLDIASVNSACYIKNEDGVILESTISVGGVSPVPLVLEKTSAFLTRKTINENTLHAAAEVLQEEISPISDVRGSDKYKRLLARQLFFAHFIKLFPGKLSGENLLSKKI